MAEEIESGQGVPMVINPQMGAIENVVDRIRYRAQLIARNQKLDSGVNATAATGFIVGFGFAVLMVLILPLIIWQVGGVI
ncbi:MULTISPECIES: tetrahydromethanopterin S-methyltransferase subunit F [Methanococcoides]|jgi:tetrahydromethanopterin S-methyltransferase subunit F|uniref:Tetrahydromethanopterin S-methyltransferase subunit F n=1 Tax=Methanococcoides burtonii (strain DSM 6242 / NBRC 107633 / OCM 468 / ACE-M) TaxID=259564 RepID=Q12VU9_METBU|nr:MULTISPECIES: tetrahydromethanopterin S-methyltransferase subunit F [Methanococcoides]ABE52427.1 Tetrahydromethanopterin S-methyltransferase subunit F [Methanococcoides burtonii DSM 6242]